MHETMAKETMRDLIAAVVRDTRGKIPVEVADAIMEVVWREYSHLDFEYKQLLLEQESVV